MSFDFVIIQIESHARHFLCEWFFQLRTPCLRENICIVDSPAAHGFAFNLCREIPNITGDVIRDGEEIKKCDPPSPLPSPNFGEIGGGLGGGHDFNHSRRMHWGVWK